MDINIHITDLDVLQKMSGLTRELLSVKTLKNQHLLDENVESISLRRYPINEGDRVSLELKTDDQSLIKFLSKGHGELVEVFVSRANKTGLLPTLVEGLKESRLFDISTNIQEISKENSHASKESKE